jgi:hypothetical protein
MATLLDLRVYLGRLAATLWNYGAEFPVPSLDGYDDGAVGFEFVAALPGSTVPKPAMIKIAEVWTPSGSGQYTRTEYAYDFVEHPLDRRRAFHRHDERAFLREHGVAVHEHCEEVLDKPVCDHYFGLPVDGDAAIRRFAVLWGQTSPLGCSRLRCIG